MSFAENETAVGADTPYGSIIVPTHDRAETLDASIRSAVRQSEPNIEILIVGDGCTQSCSSIAQSWCARDARVRFLNLPKAPMRGVANRDKAIREARSERIFYNDDDDLLLPEHVATLGRALDDCDVVDTPVTSVSPNGRLDIALHDTGNPRERSLLAEGRFKMVFDTHLAHRRSAYLGLGAPWHDGAVDNRVVLNMLRVFAQDPGIRWRTLQRITGLSFHGARRVTMPGSMRQRELAQWLEISAQPGIESSLRQRGSYIFHLFRSASALATLGLDRPSISETYRQYLSQLDEVNPMRVGRIVDAVAAVACGEKPSPDLAAQVFNELLEARLGPVFPTRRIVNHFAGLFELDVLESFIDPVGGSPSAYLAHLMICSRLGKDTTKLTNAFEERLRATSPEDDYGFALEAAAIAADVKSDPELAWVFSEWARELAPHGTDGRYGLPLWELRRKVSHVRGDHNGRREAEGMLRQLKGQPRSPMMQVRNRLWEWRKAVRLRTG